MKGIRFLTVTLALAALLAAPGFADTLILKSGERISGYFEGGSARVVQFRTADGAVRSYDILTVERIDFGESQVVENTPPTPAPAPTPTTATVAAADATPRLLPASERPPAQVASTNAANTAYTLPTGSKITIRMVDRINSETHVAGTTFVAVLEDPIVYEGIEVAPRGTDVRGRITSAQEAGRVTGAAELGLELTQIIVNGIPYSVVTSEYSEVAESRTGETAQRAGIGAAIGAGLGAVLGGGRGAIIGAGVGAGGATAVQVMTKGETLNIPAETRLEFTLRAPLVVAAR